MKNRYQSFYHTTYAELLPDAGGFLLCRSSTYGDQQNGIIIWPGDLDATMARHGETVDDAGESYVGVGGLPASIVAGLSLGPSGFPFYGADTGGYKHSPPDKETFMRWFEQTALSTVMQIGTSSNDVAWEPTPENGFDAELLDSYRIYTRLHLRLFPYLWSHAQRISSDGRPIARALGLAHPELGVHPNDVYLLGDDLLVAPVVERGARARTFMLPEGEWVHWFTGERLTGPGEQTVDAPLGRLPLFVRAGALVPLLRPTIDTLVRVGVPDTLADSYASDPGVLYVRTVAGYPGSFTLFDGGTIVQEGDASAITLRASSGSELDHGVMFELMLAPAAVSVESDGTALDAFASLAELEAAAQGYFQDGETLWIKLPAGEVAADITF
jgi:alpha-D-xyloside xylohydrolase